MIQKFCSKRPPLGTVMVGEPVVFCGFVQDLVTAFALLTTLAALTLYAAPGLVA